MITKAEVEQARSEEADVWRFGNSVLYRMCRENPHHDDLSVIVGKIWLIGRTYAAAVERFRTVEGASRVENEIFYARYAGPALMNAGIDKVLDHLGRFDDLSEESLKVV